MGLSDPFSLDVPHQVLFKRLERVRDLGARVDTSWVSLSIDSNKPDNQVDKADNQVDKP
jgi:hypothetical protein